jgi:hypothetical protein
VNPRRNTAVGRDVEMLRPHPVDHLLIGIEIGRTTL